MVQWLKRTLAIFLIGMTLIGCGAGGPDQAELRGQILVWHGWTGQEAIILDQLLDQFMAIYPGVTIIHERKDLAEIGDEFLDEARLGTGPDLLIAPARWEQMLAEAGVIQNLNDQDIDTSSYLPALTEQLHYQGGLYALPLAVHTYALYYNKRMVEKPPATLADLLEQAAEGQPVALETTFYGAFWGVQAFGGRLFDAQGRIALDQKGFADWLAWLKQAQAEPNIILSYDEELLYSLFRDSQVAYYVAGPDRLIALQQALGPEVVGVAPLPAGPHQASGPFLQAEALMFNAASTPAQTTLALQLARFLTNEAQQTKLARQAGRVPANARVRIDPRVAPAVVGFMAQTKTAVPLPVISSGFQALFQPGNQIYVQILEGVLEPPEAAQKLTTQLNNTLFDSPAGGQADAE